jgi:hypothetical protein
VAKKFGGTDVRGTGLAAGWEPSEVSHELMAAAIHAWEVAAGEANILRKFVQRDDEVYELVHDGMGPALQEWALQELDETRATLGVITPRVGHLVNAPLTPSTFAQGGEVPHYWYGVAELDRSVSPHRIVLRSLGWDACLIKSEMTDVVLEEFTLTGALFAGSVLSNVVFRRCDLRGAAFKEVTFDGVRFEDCDLHGAAIRNSRLCDAVFQPAAADLSQGGDRKLDLMSFVDSSAEGAGVRFVGLRQTLGLLLEGVSGGPWAVSGIGLRHLAVDAVGATEFVLGPGSFEHVTIRGNDVSLVLDPEASVRFSEDVDRLRAE